MDTILWLISKLFWLVLRPNTLALILAGVGLWAGWRGRRWGRWPMLLGIGYYALVLLTPLALTSFNRAIRALGARRWQQLHRLVFGVAVLAVLHFFWMRAGKNDFREVAVYAAILGLLLGWRVRLAWR